MSSQLWRWIGECKRRRRRRRKGRGRVGKNEKSRVGYGRVGKNDKSPLLLGQLSATQANPINCHKFQKLFTRSFQRGLIPRKLVNLQPISLPISNLVSLKKVYCRKTYFLNWSFYNFFQRCDICFLRVFLFPPLETICLSCFMYLMKIRLWDEAASRRRTSLRR